MPPIPMLSFLWRYWEGRILSARGGLSVVHAHPGTRYRPVYPSTPSRQFPLIRLLINVLVVSRVYLPL